MYYEISPWMMFPWMAGLGLWGGLRAWDGTYYKPIGPPTQAQMETEEREKRAKECRKELAARQLLPCDYPINPNWTRQMKRKLARQHKKKLEQAA